MSIYTPRHFASADDVAVRRLLDEFGFATLVTVPRQSPTIGDGEPLVSHVPVLHEPVDGAHGMLIGHVAAANPHAKSLAEGTSFLMFHGPNAYVSPNWYEKPAASVPTWNYVAVHAHGTIERIDDLAGKRDIVDRLSTRHEASFPKPWTTGKMDPSLLEKMLGAIVGFRMRIERIDAKFKLTQNRSAADRNGVIDGLERRGSQPERLLAEWMRTYAGGANRDA